MATKRYDQRIHVDTRLDPKKDDYLLQEIWKLQKAKKYSQTFRDAFRLILSLRKRDTTVLYELFPWLQNEPPNKEQLDNYFKPFIHKLMTDEFIGMDQQ